MRVWAAPTLVRLLERSNLNLLTTYVSVSTAIYTPNIRVCQQEVTGKSTISFILHQIYTVYSYSYTDTGCTMIEISSF